MFSRTYPLLELESIPRDSTILRAMLIDARRAKRRASLTQFAALNIVGWALFIVLVWNPLYVNARPPTSRSIPRIYVPLVVRS